MKEKMKRQYHSIDLTPEIKVELLKKKTALRDRINNLGTVNYPQKDFVYINGFHKETTERKLEKLASLERSKIDWKIEIEQKKRTRETIDTARKTGY